MNKQKLWVTISLANLCMVALLGFLLRSKILFSIPFVNYRYLLNAHTHFAFGGWVSLSLFALFVYTFLPVQRQQRFQWVLWGVALSCWGMLATLPFQGHGAAALVFSTLYLLFSGTFAFLFLKGLPTGWSSKPAFILVMGALCSMVLSAAGPLMLGWMMTSGSVNSILHRDALYYYLHFQYNGFFTLGVFALFFAQAFKTNAAQTPAARQAALLLCAAVVPSVFLSLLWHPHNLWFEAIAAVGVLLLIFSLWALWRLRKLLFAATLFTQPIARTLWMLVLLSFVVKSVLQMGTIIPALGQAVFGLRPIIIGFLHLVFLGLVSFYIIAAYVQQGSLPAQRPFTCVAVWVFAAGVIVQETLLGVQGTALLLGSNSFVYNWLLWGAGMLLFLGAVLLLLASQKRVDNVSQQVT